MDNDFAAGTILNGRYVVRERTGRSRVGTVYSAFDNEKAMEVALKAVSHRFIPGERSLSFLESHFLERREFHHPNLIQVFDCFRVELDAGKETLVVVLEKVNGIPLAEELRGRRSGVQTLGEVLKILVEVAEAMEYLHSKQVEVVALHPKRIFHEVRDSQSRVKLPAFQYFTSAEWIRDGSKWGCTTGIDYRYVAPEMIEEGSFLTGGARADLYLYGLLSFELLVGVPPFEANRETVIQLQRTEPVPENLIPHDLPSWLLELLRRALSKDPAARPELGEMKQTIARHLEAEGPALGSYLLPAEGSFVRVLFVGDNRLDQLSVARMAKSERLPFHYRIAQTVEKAEEILQYREVDVIVTDHLLPDGTSFDLLKSGAAVPVIVITGSDKTDLREAVLRAGAYACLTKDLRQAHLKSLPELLARAHKRTN